MGFLSNDSKGNFYDFFKVAPLAAVVEPEIDTENKFQSPSCNRYFEELDGATPNLYWEES